jgi:hypothetical protein
MHHPLLGAGLTAQRLSYLYYLIWFNDGKTYNHLAITCKYV